MSDQWYDRQVEKFGEQELARMLEVHERVATLENRLEYYEKFESVDARLKFEQGQADYIAEQARLGKLQEAIANAQALIASLGA